MRYVIASQFSLNSNGAMSLDKSVTWLTSNVLSRTRLTLWHWIKQVTWFAFGSIFSRGLMYMRDIQYYIYIHWVLSPIFLLKLTLFLSKTIKCMCVAKLVWSGFSALRPASFTNMCCFTLQHYHVGGGV
jgi:hypothetical protein